MFSKNGILNGLIHSMRTRIVDSECTKILLFFNEFFHSNIFDSTEKSA